MLYWIPNVFPNVQSPFYLDRILTHIELMHGIEKHQSFGVFFLYLQPQPLVILNITGF